MNLRGKVEVTYEAHNLGYVGSNPIPATKSREIMEEVLAAKDYGKMHHSPPYKTRNNVHLKCDFCGKDIYKYVSDVKKWNFCSSACRDNKLKKPWEELSPSKRERNYRAFALSQKKNECACCGYKEHVRLLDVHHIDGNRKNNALENLIVLCVFCHAAITRKLATIEEGKLIFIKINCV